MESTTIERPVPESAARRRRHGGKKGFAVLFLLGVTVVVGCRVADIDGFTPVTQLLAFLPWLLAPTGLALLLSALARSWTGLTWGVVLLGALAWYIEPYGKAAQPDGTPLARVRVMTSNVQFGQGTDALIRAVDRDRPDIVFVEECQATCMADLRDTFGDLSGENPAYPYRQAVEGYGSDGSVILSRFPLKAADPIPATMGMPGAVADVEGNPVRLRLAHPMPPLPGELGTWRRELGALRADAAADTRTPTIIAGDFNATQDHAAFRALLDTGLSDAARLLGEDRTPTWPARTTPTIGAQIDHVLVSAKDFSARKVRFQELSGTDHHAVTVDLTLHQRK
ncbi:endonuclease/exonuclease/phosphatase family protein [Streptomyces capitiformicae]|uniref:Membrane protein n=1 Tax=Streptomyces capitiformicae TaxID=2014920 RepID=A0A919GE35_9ACTN|nr:endonuclease/exonuclease/phosphatase family protein [Streptomyces capitiformicae]GHH82274.1 membrane protein [Streptomyces capitiformicae]